MKKLIALILAGIFALTLSGCVPQTEIEYEVIEVERVVVETQIEYVDRVIIETEVIYVDKIITETEVIYVETSIYGTFTEEEVINIMEELIELSIEMDESSAIMDLEYDDVTQILTIYSVNNEGVREVVNTLTIDEIIELTR